MDIRKYLNKDSGGTGGSGASRRRSAASSSAKPSSSAQKSAPSSASKRPRSSDPARASTPSKKGARPDPESADVADVADVADATDAAAPPPPAKKARWVPRTDDPPNRGKKPLPIGAPDCLSGKVFVISGILDSLLREECADLCKQYGARVVGGVSGKVTHGIIGTEPGASKLAKLKSLKTPTIDEDQLFAMITETRPVQRDQPMPDADDDKPVDQIKKDPVRQSPRPKSSRSSRSESSSKKPSSAKALKAEPTPADKSAPNSSAATLWVDKYRPNTTDQLVANGGIIRDLRKWLDGWKDRFLRSDGHKVPLSHRGDFGMAAAFLVGPPGIGKTTAALAVCREAGFEPHEYNASDVRNKSGIHSLAETVMVANTMFKYLAIGKNTRPTNQYRNGQVLIMDEVDGMSGGDRGGSQELIKLIKSTKVPIICIANDDSSANMRSLSNYCYRMRFRKPTVVQVTKRLTEIARREGFRAMQDQTLGKLAEGCNGDIRQMINLLQTWRLSSTSLSYTQVKERLDVEGKTVIQKSVFELAKSFFNPGIEGSANSLSVRTDNYFADSDIMPLFVQENYIHTIGASQSLDALADAAESISEGDICNASVRGGQHWELMPSCAILSAIRPGSLVGGGLARQPQFPSYLGNLSRGNKWKRIVQGLEMKVKAVQTTTGSTCAFRLDYIPALTTCLATPLIRNGAAGAGDVIERLDAYFLEKDPDWEEILDAGVYPKGRSPLENIKGPVKTALTREYNSRAHARSSVTGTRVGSSKAASADVGVSKATKKAEAEAVGVLDDEEEADGIDDGDGESGDEGVVKEFGVKKQRKGSGRGRGKGRSSSGRSGGSSAAGSSGSKSGSGGRGGRGRGRGRGGGRGGGRGRKSR